MTEEEAKVIVANAKPIVLPKRVNTININENKRIMTFSDLKNRLWQQ